MSGWSPSHDGDDLEKGSPANGHSIAHAAVVLSADAHARMQANVTYARWSEHPEEKRHWLVGGFAAEMSPDELAGPSFLALRRRGAPSA